MAACTTHTTRAMWFQDQYARFLGSYVETCADIAVLAYYWQSTTQHWWVHSSPQPRC